MCNLQAVVCRLLDASAIFLHASFFSLNDLATHLTNVVEQRKIESEKSFCNTLTEFRMVIR